MRIEEKRRLQIIELEAEVESLTAWQKYAQEQMSDAALREVERRWRGAAVGAVEEYKRHRRDMRIGHIISGTRTEYLADEAIAKLEADLFEALRTRRNPWGFSPCG